MLISVVTPAYNAEQYIGETIQSLIEQEILIEHIIVDDGSIDNTGAAVCDIMKKNPSIHWYDLKYYRQENAGEQNAVNTGLEFVTGDYFMILNADDKLVPTGLRALVYGLERNPDALGIYPDWTIINAAGDIVRPIKAPEWDLEYMIRGHRCIPSVGCLFRSKVIDLVGGRDPQFRYVGDFDYWLRVGLFGDLIHLPLHVAQWRRHNGSATAATDNSRADQRRLLVDKFYSLPGSEKYLPVRPEAYAWSYIVAAVESGTLKRSLDYIAAAIMSDPVLLARPRFWKMLYDYAVYYLKVRL